MERTIEQRTMRKVYRRILPFTGLLYFICYLDRVNVGFAALTMRQDLGLSQAALGLGMGTAFFIGYFMLEVPSNVALHKFGARLWIARIMISWGLVSGATAFVSGEYSFFAVRFLLGLAEAGFFPGMILFFTYWFPPVHRGRIIAGFMTAIPISIALGAPVSTTIMELHGAFGLAGWKWLFLLEATPAILLGIVCLFYLTDRPEKASWLQADEKAWLAAELAKEQRQIESVGSFTLWQSLYNPRVIALALIYFGIAAASVGLVMFLAQIIKELGLSNLVTGYVAAIPYVIGTVGMIVAGFITDRMGERRWNCFTLCLTAAAGLTVAGLTHGTWWSLIGLSIATVGFYGMKPSFWPMPSLFLTGTAAAAGIAWINALGNLAGTITPWVVGYMKDVTGSFAGGLFALAGFAVFSAVVTLIGIPSDRKTTAALASAARAPAE
ncbi:MAG TPA: MFS transporter [Stellaceae bacterium]|jgi:ACS family tartrate transporter-like MFS transporter|nr:MFS transporter [Stellaceae bacterium]